MSLLTGPAGSSVPLINSAAFLSPSVLSPHQGGTWFGHPEVRALTVDLLFVARMPHSRFLCITAVGTAIKCSSL